MERESLKEIILNAPAWARVGLTVRNERLRDKAASELAEVILAGMDAPDKPDLDQLPLPF